MATETVLITGCSSGIGRATAEAFLDEGWTVYATARDTDDLTALKERGAEIAELDVTDGTQVHDAVERVVAGEGGLECLVNNAGYAQFGAVEDVPPRRVHRQFDVNLYGPHRLVRAALPHMREAGEGTIVNVSSVAGLVSVPGNGVYCASKAALESLSDALRAELAGLDVDVVLVEPGPVETNFRDRAAAELEGISRSAAYGWLYDLLSDYQAVRGVGAVPPEQVADAVLNAASCTDPAARYPVGPVARATGILRHLPAQWRDAAYRLASKLPT